MLPTINEFQGWAVTGIFGVLGAFGVWLRLNKTQTEITKTQTEGGWISQLVKDRDEAIRREKETWTAYSKLKEDHAKLELQGILRDEKIARLEKRIDMLSDIIVEYRPELAAFLRTSAYGDLELVHPITDIKLDLKKPDGANDG